MGFSLGSPTCRGSILDLSTLRMMGILVNIGFSTKYSPPTKQASPFLKPKKANSCRRYQPHDKPIQVIVPILYIQTTQGFDCLGPEATVYYNSLTTIVLLWPFFFVGSYRHRAKKWMFGKRRVLDILALITAFMYKALKVHRQILMSFLPEICHDSGACLELHL